MCSEDGSSWRQEHSNGEHTVYCSTICEFAFIWGLDFHLLNTISFFTLIISFGCHTVCMWAMLPTFRRYMLPPFSWSKCVGWWLCYVLNSRENGDWCHNWPVGRAHQEICVDGPFEDPWMQTKYYWQHSWAVKRPVCTTFWSTVPTGLSRASVPTIPSPFPPLN
jgi:hypothetical protein